MNFSNQRAIIILIILAVATVGGSIYLFAEVPNVVTNQALPISAITTQPNISWSTPRIEVTLSPGESTSREVSFLTSAALQNISIEAVPEIAKFINIQPDSLATVAAGDSQTVHLVFSVPIGTARGTYFGTLHVRSGKQTLSQTLKVSLSVWTRYSNTDRGFSFQFPPELVVSPASPLPNSGVYVAGRVEEYPGEGITIARHVGNRAGVISNLSPATILSQSTVDISGIQWALVIDQEQESGLQFLTAIAEQNDTVITVSTRNTSTTVSLVQKIISTLTFL